MNAVVWSRVRYHSGALEALKYLALLSMVADHVNKALFGGAVAWLVPVGRLAFPIFACVMAYNLARSNVQYGRMLHRLFLVAVIATPFHPVIMGSWLPLNVLFTFFVAVAVIVQLQRREWFWAAVSFAGALFVDYQWSGVALVVFAWYFAQRPTWWAAAGVLCSLAGVSLLVGNAWSFAAIPVLLLAQHYAPAVPRLRWFFWAFYPVHLALLWSLAR